VKKLIKNPEYYVLVVATGLCVIVAILDFLGLLGGIPWLVNRIPTLVLLLVSVMLGYLIVERRNKLDVIEGYIQTGNQETLATLEAETEKIITALQGVNIRLFERREDVYIYLEKKVRKKKRTNTMSSKKQAR
jgi:hypothetical protein